MSDTPRTDKSYRDTFNYGIGCLYDESKQLERELNAANERINLPMAANSDVARIAAERDRAHEHIKRLEEAGDAMAQDHNPFTFIDWQRVKEVKP